jgi:hypothetical protein
MPSVPGRPVASTAMGARNARLGRPGRDMRSTATARRHDPPPKPSAAQCAFRATCPCLIALFSLMGPFASARGPETPPPGDVTATGSDSAQIGLQPVAHAPAPPVVPPTHRRLPPTAIGLYGGYPSYGGLQIVAPVDGALGFRSGLTGFPNVGILWTPGVEVRFGQESGTYNHSGPYAFSNLRLGRSETGHEHMYVGNETGAGFRFLFWDRRGYRWILAGEVGGAWEPGSLWPEHTAGKLMWMVAGS